VSRAAKLFRGSLAVTEKARSGEYPDLLQKVSLFPVLCQMLGWGMSKTFSIITKAIVTLFF